jgi:UDP-glucose 6-dehydrogenase
MANPNIVNVTAIYGKTAVLAVTTTATAIVTNSAASNKVFKVNALYVSNIDGTNNAEITVDVFRSSVAYRIASTIVVPADATLDVISNPIYLEEGDSLRLTANANSDLEAVCSYEDIS